MIVTKAHAEACDPPIATEVMSEVLCAPRSCMICKTSLLPKHCCFPCHQAELIIAIQQGAQNGLVHTH